MYPVFYQTINNIQYKALSSQIFKSIPFLTARLIPPNKYSQIPTILASVNGELLIHCGQFTYHMYSVIFTTTNSPEFQFQFLLYPLSSFSPQLSSIHQSLMIEPNLMLHRFIFISKDSSEKNLTKSPRYHPIPGPHKKPPNPIPL